MTKTTPYQHAMQYQKRLDEENGFQPLPTPLEFIKMTGVTKSNPDSVECLKQLCREALYVREGLSGNKKQLINETLKLLEQGKFDNDQDT